PGGVHVDGEARPNADASRSAPLIVDLSALWAGPLCTHLLGRTGARVIKVESLQRPDGSRRGVASFHDLLNSGKASVAIDVNDETGRSQLRDLLDGADIVVSSSRRRAFDQLGIDPMEVLQAESVDVSPEALRAGDGLAAVLRAARRTRPTGWLRATGYDVASSGPIDRDVLDDIGVGPIRVQDRTGILWILDSSALDVVGLHDDRDGPSGVEICDHRPTGRLFRLDRWLGERVPRHELDMAAVATKLAASGIVG